jgi:sugar/nucleoside kinase (ribokinase family)
MATPDIRFSPEPVAAVAGHLCLDIIPSFPGEPVTLADLLVPGKLVNVGPPLMGTGGPVSNTGLSLHRLGVPVRLVGKVGRDVFGRVILDLVRQLGSGLADNMIVGDDFTSYTVVVNPPGTDRMFLHYPGANDTFGAGDIDYAALARLRLFHLGYPPLMRRMYADGGGELEAIYTKVRQTGVTTSLDMARPDPASPAGRADWPRILARVLPRVDVFVPSYDEILFMLDRPRFDRLAGAPGGNLAAAAGTDAVNEMAERLIAMGAALVGLKLGDAGMLLRTTDSAARLTAMGRAAPARTSDWLGRQILAPCYRADVVGTTGSGDATIAGFLLGLLAGFGPEHAANAATAVGACSVEKADATSGIPPWSAVRDRMEAGWPRLPSPLAPSAWRKTASGLYLGPRDGHATA